MKNITELTAESLSILCPNGGWIVRGNTIEWNDSISDKPTEEEIVQKVAELEYQEEVNEYQRQRAREYPSYADQFDQIFHEGVDAWKRTILDIKKKYPKQVMEPEVLAERQRQALADLEESREEEST